MGPTSSSGVNRVGDLWFFGTKVGCGPCDELFHCGNGMGRFEINPSQHLVRSKMYEMSNRQQEAALEVERHCKYFS